MAGKRFITKKIPLFLKASGHVHGAGRAGAILVKNMLNVRTKKMDINLEMELGASIKGGIQYALQVPMTSEPSQPNAPFYFYLLKLLSNLCYVFFPRQAS